MNTQTHLLLASAALGRRARPGEQAAILAGATLPDLSIFALVLWAVLTGIPSETLWSRTYWSEPWQTFSAVSNSVFLWGGVIGLGAAVRRPWLAFLGTAALLHVTLDFPVHAEDAHRHFWPVSDWRFHSPVSYWDPAYHGRLVGAGEALLGIGLTAALWRRHSARWARALLAVCALAYLAVPIFWLAALG